ncbi:HAD family hydrolase [Conexibacter stalactiti]|uniref:HAD family hydrolase n=1 Tax=Conexibacter stalactiti TaxID=1940611 RepID=A0ABU4HW32_9ACTN|nr:HAD family hydrolase [Conexibacter stalactiti]MDW5597433.1 HAD family hydrolase [Conexibacter stalactiti]MEC5038075.1 HAD family hydrolase [Conexibacter stalactiti]
MDRLQPRVIVSDADMTLVQRGDEIHPLTRQALALLSADGIPCVLATGRPIPSALRLGRAINAAYVVALGGAVVVATGTGEVVWAADPYATSWVPDVWDAAIQHGTRIQAHTLTGWHSTITDAKTAAYAARHDLPPAADGPPTAPIMLAEFVGDYAQLGAEREMPPASRDAHNVYVDISAGHEGKAGGVAHALALLDRTWAGALAVGDGGNDLTMFYKAASSIVVGPDPDPLLLEAASHHVTLTPDDGAVGAALLHLVYGDSDHGAHVRALS